MREFINAILLFENAIPDRLYHGTSDDGWEGIQASNSMIAMEGAGSENAICFSSSSSVAEDFVRQACGHDFCDQGVVIAFDARKLAQDYQIVPFHDSSLSGSYTHFLNEKEYRIEQATVPNIMQYIVSTYPVWQESAPDFHEKKSDSELVTNAVEQVRNSLRGKFQGNCEGAAGDLSDLLNDLDIDHEVVEGRYMKEMDWGDGRMHPFTPHWWVEVGHFILDPTREQFGSSALISNKNHKETSMCYQYGGVGTAG